MLGLKVIHVSKKGSWFYWVWIKWMNDLGRPQVSGGLTHWGWDKMDAISQTTISNTFSWMKMLEFRLKFHWSLFLRVQLTIIQHLFRWWLGADQATSHYLNQWWLDYQRIYASLGLNELIVFLFSFHRCRWHSADLSIDFYLNFLSYIETWCLWCADVWVSSTVHC